MYYLYKFKEMMLFEFIERDNMFDFILGKKVKVIEKVNLISSEWYKVEILMPFDILDLYRYLTYLDINNIKSVDSTPKSFKKIMVPYWVSDSKGNVYDYEILLNSIFTILDKYEETKCIKLSNFLTRISLSLEVLNLEFKYIRMKDISKK